MKKFINKINSKVNQLAIHAKTVLVSKSGEGYEKAFEIQDMISDLEAKYQASDLYFEQDTLDIYRPGIPHDQRWAAMTFIELMFYAISPDSYTKEVHEMMPDEDSGCARMQTKT